MTCTTCGAVPEYVSEDGRAWCATCMARLVEEALTLPPLLSVEEILRRLEPEP